GAGACAANYVRAIGLAGMAEGSNAVRARDELTGEEVNIRGRCIIDATGPWGGEWMGITQRERKPLYSASKAFSLLTRPLPFKEGMGFAVRQQSSASVHTYFVLPWNGRTLVGTRHAKCDPSVRSASVTRREIVD